MWRKILGYIGVAMVIAATLGALRFWEAAPVAKSLIATVVFGLHFAYALALRYINLGAAAAAIAGRIKTVSTFLLVGSIIVVLLQWNVAPWWNPVLTAMITLSSMVALVVIDVIVTTTLL